MLFTFTFWTRKFILILSVKTIDLSFRCMVHGNPFYISIVAPVAAIIMTNLIVLVKVTVRLHRRFKHRSVISEVRIAFAFNLLLGTTWVLAFFAIEEVTMVFQWLFCITNSLQGLFIFLFYTVQNREVRKTWLNALGKDPLSKSSQSNVSGNTSSKDKEG